MLSAKLVGGGSGTALISKVTAAPSIVTVRVLISEVVVGVLSLEINLCIQSTLAKGRHWM